MSGEQPHTTIAHLSDVHFGATDPAVVEGLVADLQALAPSLVVISGDLTMGARRAEFRAARAFMDRLPAPTLCVPGNHDITPYRLIERFLAPYARWRQEIAPETEPTWQNNQVAVLGLNTAQRAGPTLDWSRGRVTHRRLARLLTKLDALPNHLIRIVVAHHPLLAPEGETTPQIATNATQAIAALATRHVHLILAGHLHRSYARLTQPNGPAPLILQGGSATSTRLRGEPNAYNRITIPQGAPTQIEGRAWQRGKWEMIEARNISLKASVLF